MVHFRDSASSRPRCLVISNHKGDKMETRLSIDTPLVGQYASTWPPLTDPFPSLDWTLEYCSRPPKAWSLCSPNHRDTNIASPLPCLGRRILKGEINWSDTLSLNGEFHFIPGYWEWADDVLCRCQNTLKATNIYDAVYASMFTYDRNTNIMQAFYEAWCPLTNTLLTSHGELSISLWDLYTIGGLPMIGFPYEEAVPNTEELTRTNDKDKRFIALSCEHLFDAFHQLQKGDSNPTVPVTKWIQFWSNKATKHHQPPLRKEKKAVRPKATHNPSKDIGKAVANWTSTEEALFAKLGAKGHKRDETYLAAFLACWLCTFVLPSKGGDFIRPGTFKVASYLASGRKIGLAVPVLASIYKGLNMISECSQLDSIDVSFSTHYLYGWLAHYFKTHYALPNGPTIPLMTIYSGEGGAKYFEKDEARTRIQKGDAAIWLSTTPERLSPFHYHDNISAQELDTIYFMSLRSNYLPLRDGHSFIIEPYSPHRFSRQFGFLQDVPGYLIQDLRTASLEEGIRFARLCVMTNSKSRAIFPPVTSSMKKSYVSMRKHHSSNYTSWWNKVHGSFLEDNIQFLVNAGGPTISAPLEDIDQERSKEVIVVDEPFNLKVKRSGHRKGQGKELQVLTEAPKEEIHVQDPQGDSEFPSLNDHVKDAQSPNKRSSQDKDGSSNGDRCWKHKKARVEKLEDTNESAIEVHSTGSLSKTLIVCSERENGAEHSTAKLDEEVSSARQDGGLSRSISNSSKAPLAPSKSTTGISIFEGRSVVFNRKKKYIYGLWEDISDSLSEINLDSISKFEEEIKPIFEEMQESNITDFSPLKNLMDSFLELATSYN